MVEIPARERTWSPGRQLDYVGVRIVLADGHISAVENLLIHDSLIIMCFLLDACCISYMVLKSP